MKGEKQNQRSLIQLHCMGKLLQKKRDNGGRVPIGFWGMYIDKTRQGDVRYMLYNIYLSQHKVFKTKQLGIFKRVFFF